MEAQCLVHQNTTLLGGVLLYQADCHRLPS